MKPIFRIGQRLVAAYQEFLQDGGLHLAAATAYFFGLGLLPFLTVVIAGLGYFLQATTSGQDAQEALRTYLRGNVSDDVASQVLEMLTLIKAGASQGGLVGVGMLLATAIAVFAQLQAAFDRIWSVDEPPSTGLLGLMKTLLWERAMAFLMLAGTGALILFGFALSTVVATLQARTRELLPEPNVLWAILQFALSFGVNLLAFAAIYRWLPKKPVVWADAVSGAILVTCCWELGRHLLATFLIGTQYASAYGLVGTFLGLMVWCYYGSLLLLIGAEYVETLGRERQQTLPSMAASESV